MITLNGQEVKFGQFPNKETNLPFADLIIEKVSTVKWIYEDDSDFFKIALLKNFLDDMNCVTVNLICTYFPHSRMDRVNGFYAVSLNTAAEIINNLCFEAVSVREPHSPLTINLLDNSFGEEWCAARVADVLLRENYDSIFLPDYGALKRYEDVDIPKRIKISHGKKMRDFESGNIETLEIRGDIGSRVLIVDDLCSRGGTFVRGSKLLKEKGAERVGLLVAYCEENVYSGELFDHINTMYTSKDCLFGAERHNYNIVKID